jgi:asparagine synthase (glutamine-hydrolysing)
LEVAVEDDLAVVFAGWLSNRNELEPAAGRHTGSNAALILARYRWKGRASLAALTGRFAVVVFDAARDQVVATRDQLGTYPLFWAASGEELLFSNGIHVLLSQPGVSRELNRAALADHLRWQWPDPGETFFSALRRVPPAHALVDDAGGRRCLRNWQPVAPGVPRWASAEEVATFEDAFAAAVGRTLQLAPLGIWLSGGLDSVSVAALAADAAGERPPLALSLWFPDDDNDEHLVQRSIAQQLSMPQVMMPLSEAVAPFGVLEAMVDMGRDWPAPLSHPWLAAYVALARIGVARGCAAILTGHGGDEWLAVTPYVATDRLARLDLAGVARVAAVARRSHGFSTWDLVQAYGWTFGLRPLVGRRLLGRLSSPALAWRDHRQLQRLTPDWLAPDPELARQIDDRFVPEPAPTSFYERELERSLDHPLAAMDFEEIYHAGQRAGAPIISPFVDVRLVELLYRVPPDVLNGGGRSKGLVRWGLGRRFPELRFDSQKKVSGMSTLVRLMGEEAASLWRTAGCAPSLERLGIVDQRFLDQAAEEAFREPPGLKTRRLFDVLAAETFVRAHGEV